MTYPNHQQGMSLRAINNRQSHGRDFNINAPQHNNQSGEDIFESHSAYKKTYTGPQFRNSNSPYGNYGNYTVPANNNYFSMSSVNQNYNPRIQDRIPPVHRAGSTEQASAYQPHQHHHVPNSMSFDSWVSEQFYQQQRQYARMVSAVKSAKKELGDVEHEMLAREEEYFQLTRVQKNPSQEDCIIIQSEYCELQRSIQQLYHDCDTIGMSLPGESFETPAATNHPTISEPVPQRPFAISSPQTLKRQGAYKEKTRRPMMPLESPTSKLLRDPIDNSLVFSQYDS